VPELAGAIASVAASAGPLELSTGPGAGDGRGRGGSLGVTWLTLERGAPDVRSLCASLDPLLPLDALGTSQLRRPPDAHVTIARRASPGLIRALHDQALGPTGTAWTAERMVLYRSHTGSPAGSRYEALAEARLGVRAAA
jgi:2'-5' RNA ligase